MFEQAHDPPRPAVLGRHNVMGRDNQQTGAVQPGIGRPQIELPPAEVERDVCVRRPGLRQARQKDRQGHARPSKFPLRFDRASPDSPDGGARQRSRDPVAQLEEQSVALEDAIDFRGRVEPGHGGTVQVDRFGGRTKQHFIAFPPGPHAPLDVLPVERSVGVRSQAACEQVPPEQRRSPARVQGAADRLLVLWDRIEDRHVRAFHAKAGPARLFAPASRVGEKDLRCHRENAIRPPFRGFRQRVGMEQHVAVQQVNAAKARSLHSERDRGGETESFGAMNPDDSGELGAEFRVLFERSAVDDHDNLRGLAQPLRRGLGALQTVREHRGRRPFRNDDRDARLPRPCLSTRPRVTPCDSPQRARQMKCGEKRKKSKPGPHPPHPRFQGLQREAELARIAIGGPIRGRGFELEREDRLRLPAGRGEGALEAQQPRPPAGIDDGPQPFALRRNGQRVPPPVAGGRQQAANDNLRLAAHRRKHRQTPASAPDGLATGMVPAGGQLEPGVAFGANESLERPRPIGDLVRTTSALHSAVRRVLPAEGAILCAVPYLRQRLGRQVSERRVVTHFAGHHVPVGQNTNGLPRVLVAGEDSGARRQLVREIAGQVSRRSFRDQFLRREAHSQRRETGLQIYGRRREVPIEPGAENAVRDLATPRCGADEQPLGAKLRGVSRHRGELVEVLRPGDKTEVNRRPGRVRVGSLPQVFRQLRPGLRKDAAAFIQAVERDRQPIQAARGQILESLGGDGLERGHKLRYRSRRMRQFDADRQVRVPGGFTRIVQPDDLRALQLIEDLPEKRGIHVIARATDRRG